MERTSRWSPLNIISAKFSILVALRELWSAESCSIPSLIGVELLAAFRALKAGTNLLVCSKLDWNHTSIPIKLLTIFHQKTLFQTPKATPRQYKWTRQKLKGHKRTFTDFRRYHRTYLQMKDSLQTYSQYIFQNWLYLGFLHASYISRSCILLHEVAWSWAFMPALIPTFWVVPSPDFAASLISIVSGMAEKS